MLSWSWSNKERCRWRSRYLGGENPAPRWCLGLTSCFLDLKWFVHFKLPPQMHCELNFHFWNDCRIRYLIQR